MREEFEKALAYHCAPALAGIKAGNLISCSKEKYPNFPEMIKLYQDAMKQKGICFEILHECDRNYLLFMYRKNLLKSRLEMKEIRGLLVQIGYPPFGTLEEMIDYLKIRFEENQEFPHEVGVFLGYPPQDILGFWKNRGKNYKLCGHWKVYGDVEEARRMFQQFDKCRNGICRRLSEGISLTQMFCPA